MYFKDSRLDGVDLKVSRCGHFLPLMVIPGVGLISGHLENSCPNSWYFCFHTYRLGKNPGYILILLLITRQCQRSKKSGKRRNGGNVSNVSWVSEQQRIRHLIHECKRNDRRTKAPSFGCGSNHNFSSFALLIFFLSFASLFPLSFSSDFFVTLFYSWNVNDQVQVCKSTSLVCIKSIKKMEWDKRHQREAERKRESPVWKKLVLHRLDFLVLVCRWHLSPSLLSTFSSGETFFQGIKQVPFLFRRDILSRYQTSTKVQFQVQRLLEVCPP